MNNVDLELMGLFATVVEQGSFTGAAEALGMPKSSVSQKISRLETQLGVRLLQRTTRRLSLTPQGEIYVEQCQALLALARSANLAMARLRAAPAGRVRITAPEATGTLLLGRILADFRALYPEVVLELTLCDDQLDLVGEGYDLALRAAPLKDSSLICRRIGQVPRHLVAAPGYLAAHGAPQQLSELGLHPCLVHSALPVWPLQEGAGGRKGPASATACWRCGSWHCTKAGLPCCHTMSVRRIWRRGGCRNCCRITPYRLIPSISSTRAGNIWRLPCAR